jgi:hypothetical protein
MSHDPGPLMSPDDFQKTENLLAEFVRRKQAGIPLSKRLQPPVSPLLKAVQNIQNSMVRRHVEFAKLNAKLAAVKSDVDRQTAARAGREREALAKSIAQTQALIKSNPDRKPLAYVAEIQRQLDAMVARLGDQS